MSIELGIYAELHLSCAMEGGEVTQLQSSYLVPGVGVGMETMRLKGMGQCKVGIMSTAESIDKFSK